MNDIQTRCENQISSNDNIRPRCDNRTSSSIAYRQPAYNVRNAISIKKYIKSQVKIISNKRINTSLRDIIDGEDTSLMAQDI